MASNNTKSKSNYDSPYFCDKESFKQIFQVEKRRSNRDWHNVYLVNIIILVNSADKEEISAANSLVKKVLIEQVRQGDIICPWQENQFLVLLHDILEADIESVMKRLDRAFNNEKRKCQEFDCWFNNQGNCQQKNRASGSFNQCERLHDFENIRLKWNFHPLHKDYNFTDK